MIQLLIPIVSRLLAGSVARGGVGALGRAAGSSLLGNLGGKLASTVAQQGIAQSFSALTANSKNFGSILSGQTTQQQVAQQAQQGPPPSLAGLFKDLALATTGLAISFKGIPAILKGFSEGVNNSNEKFRQFNGGIAMSFARLDFGRLQNTYKSAGARGESASSLADAVKSMEDSTRPLTDIVAIGVNWAAKLAAIGVNLGATIFKHLPIISTMVAAVESNTKKTPGPGDNRPIAGLQEWATRDLTPLK